MAPRPACPPPTFVGVCVFAALVAIALVLGRSPQQASVPAAVKPNAANAAAGGVAAVPEGTAQAVQQQGNGGYVVPVASRPAAADGGPVIQGDGGYVVSDEKETVPEEIIDLPPKSRLLKLPRAGSEGGEPSAMIYSMVCTCAKCGSTSFFRSLYKIAFGEDWPYSGEPWVQNLASHRWKGVADVALNDYDMLQQNSFALIRDPKDRLLSAFRSKVTCDKGKGVDEPGRKRIVPKLLELAGLLPLERYGLQAPGSEDGGLCLNMTTYLQALGEVWRSGREAELDWHFLPQTNSCFLNLPPSNWKVVTTIDRPGALCALESVVRGAVTSRNGTAARDSDDCSFIKIHSTKKGGDATLSEEEEMLLEEITRKEYEVLGPYL